MKIEDIVPGTRIIERHKQATPKTVMGWDRGKTFIRVRNDHGRVTEIDSANIWRYKKIEDQEET